LEGGRGEVLELFSLGMASLFEAELRPQAEGVRLG
jgi:hypothetical protein